MRKNPIFLVLLAILVAQPLLTTNLGIITPVENNGVFTPALGTRLAPEDHTNHVPILIDGNDDFVSQGWPGSGTSGDPYIISALNITYANGMILISITDTTAYFVIRDCYLDQGSAAWAIDFHNASNGVIEHCTVNSDKGGMWIYQSNSTTITNTEVTNLGSSNPDYALWTQWSWDISVEDCVFETPNYRCSWFYFADNLILNNNQWIGYASQDALTINYFNHTIINHCTITEGEYGLSMRASYDPVITDLTITETTWGMEFSDCGAVSISDSHSTTPATALAMVSCNDSSIINSDFWCDDNLDPAINILTSHRLTFTGNTLEDAEAWGLVIMSSEECVVNDNTFINCEPVGISLSSSPDSEIIGNTVHGSGGSGIETHSSHRCTIHDNDIYYAESGIYGNDPNNSTIIGNTIDTTLGAIYLDSSADYVNVSDNVISNTEYGIYIDGGDWCRIHDNTISDATEGMHFDNGEDLDVYNNIISTSSFGILYTTQDDMHIHHNTISDAENGIFESTVCNRIRIEENTIDLSERGITIRSFNSSILNNMLSNIGIYGIRLFSTSNSIVEGNTITGAPVYGVLTYQAFNASIVDNTLTGCGLVLDGAGSMVFFNHSISGNTVNGGSIYYGVSETSGSASLATYSQIILLNCSYMDIVGASVGQVSIPVQLFYCLNITMSGINSVPNVRTLTAYETDNMTISDITSIGRDSEFDFTESCLHISYCDDFTIENVEYSDGYYGIVLSNSNDGFISEYNADYAYRGISGGSSNNIVVDNCEISNMGYQGIVANGDNWNVTNCYIHNTTYGIYASGGLDHYFADNVLEHNERGISVSGSSTDDGIIFHNEISNNVNYGIRIENGDTWDILNNTILWTGEYGIYLSGSSGTEVYYNIVGISGTQNGYDSAAQNWDDGVDTGNWWSDYSGTGTYSVGSGVDNYPMRFLPYLPIISSPINLYYAEGGTGNEITWLVYDNYLSHYSISIDGSVWVATACPDLTLSEITLNVDGLAYGDHSVVITVWDIEDNTVSHSMTIHVFDDTPPSIDPEPNREAFVEGSGQEITWAVFDLHPGQYTVMIDETVSATGTWTSGYLSADIDGLAVGIHVVIMIIYDLDGNSATDTVELLVISDSTDPVIDSPDDITIVYGSTGNRIIWTPTDVHPSGYEVSENSSVFIAGTWGGSRIIIDIDGLEVGEYTFVLTVWDGSGNEVSDSVTVVVVPYEGWTPGPPQLDLTMILIIAGVGVGVVVIVAAVYFLKSRRS